MPRNFTKKQKAEVRRLNGLAWERELSVALDHLHRDFDALKSGDISAFDMSDRIHRFHDYTARDLYKCYTYGDSYFAVPSAIARGIIDRSEVSSELLKLLEPTIKDLSEEPYGGTVKNKVLQSGKPGTVTVAESLASAAGAGDFGP